MTLHVCVTEQTGNGCSIPLPLPSSWCDVSGQRGFGPAICYEHTSPYFSHPVPLPPSIAINRWCLSALRHGHVTSSLVAYYTSAPQGTAADLRRAPKESEANPYSLCTNLLRNLLHDVMHAQEDLTAPPKKYHSVRRHMCELPTLRVGRLLLHGNDNRHFPDEASKKSSRNITHTSTIPISTTSRFQKFQLSTAFLVPSSGQEQVASPVDR